MEEIRIYHSPWRMLLLFLGSVAFVAGGIFMLQQGSHVFIAWLSIVFFGWCGLYMLYGTLKERLTGRPYLTITDEAVICEGMKQTVIRFADVKSFQVVKMGEQEFVAVHYKPELEQQKMDEANILDRSVRKLNRRLVDSQENISTNGTGKKAQALCDLLNERLKRK